MNPDAEPAELGQESRDLLTTESLDPEYRERLGWDEAVVVAEEPPGWSHLTLLHGEYLGERIDDAIGTIHAWKQAGLTSLDRHLAQSKCQPWLRVVYHGTPGALLTGAQIVALYAELAKEREHWFTGEWYAHPRLGTLTASAEFLASESGRYKVTTRQILQSVGATSYTVPLYGGHPVEVYSIHAFEAGLEWERWLTQGKEMVTADAVTGRVIGSVQAWCRHLGVGNVDHLRRRLKATNARGARSTPYDAQPARLYTDEEVREAWPELFDQPALQVAVSGRVIDPETGRRYVQILSGSWRKRVQSISRLRVVGTNRRPSEYFAEDETCHQLGRETPVITEAQRAAELALPNPHAGAGVEVDRLLLQAQALARAPRIALDAGGTAILGQQQVVPKSLLTALAALLPAFLKPEFETHLQALEPVGLCWMSWPGHWQDPVLLEAYSQQDYRTLRALVEEWLRGHGSGLKSGTHEIIQVPRLVQLPTGEYVPAGWDPKQPRPRPVSAQTMSPKRTVTPSRQQSAPLTPPVRHHRERPVSSHTSAVSQATPRLLARARPPVLPSAPERRPSPRPTVLPVTELDPEQRAELRAREDQERAQLYEHWAAEQRVQRAALEERRRLHELAEVRRQLDAIASIPQWQADLETARARVREAVKKELDILNEKPNWPEDVKLEVILNEDGRGVCNDEYAGTLGYWLDTYADQDVRFSGQLICTYAPSYTTTDGYRVYRERDILRILKALFGHGK